MIKKKKPELKLLISKYNKFHSLIIKLTNTNPFAAVYLMHEFSRNLYPADPYLPFKNNNHYQRIDLELTQLTSMAAKFFSRESYGRYKTNKFINSRKLSIEETTGSVYAPLWSSFNLNYASKVSKKIFFDRFLNNGFSKKDIINKSVADIGCGSGRYTFALNVLKPKELIGIDGSIDCIKVANAFKKKFKEKNIKFKKLSNLRLASFFKKKKFDFVLSNGVIHHTSDFKKSFDQIVKITKKNGKILIYIYGAGGIFWYARKKMREVFKKIPQEFTMKVLSMLGMPSERFVFVDNWYVPLEKHTTTEEFEKILRKYNFKSFKRLLKSKIKTDLDVAANDNKKIGKIIWGNGELRYLITK